ncbi:MAG: cytochrome C [Desulfuromonadaceae bacterium]|nr:cytochrome C [Desulfuromonadaceae bacterium]MDD2849145.1 cytochrome C [Desulfuromonadaceae bacterium]MDD4129513.1 cytochrome C [Desulfuromonadaceae bacterium]
MNRTSHVLIALLVLVSASIAAAKDAPSVERGSKLFNSDVLGTNGRSCATCHPGGKGLEDVANAEAKELVTPVNNCIVKAMKGKALSGNSAEMHSLVMYLNKLGKAKPQ